MDGGWWFPSNQSDLLFCCCCRITSALRASKKSEETITYLCHLPVLINWQFYIILSSIICNTTLKYDSGYDVGDYNNNNNKENGNDMLKLMSVCRRVTMLVLRAGSWQSFLFRGSVIFSVLFSASFEIST